MPQPARVVFVVSTGRTGTVSIARTLNRLAPRITARHEPPPSRPLRVLGNAYACGHVSERTVRAALRATVGRRIVKAPGSVYVEASPYLRTLIGPLARMYPHACFAHIVRNPSEYMLSYAGHGAFDGIKGLLAQSVPFWLLKPETLEPDAPTRWRDMPLGEALAWRWYTLNRIIQSNEAELGARYARFRFEDLFAGAAGFRPLLRWIEPDGEPGSETPTPQRANARGETPTAARLASGGIDPATVVRICGPLAAAYGYDSPQ